MSSGERKRWEACTRDCTESTKRTLKRLERRSKEGERPVSEPKGRGKRVWPVGRAGIRGNPPPAPKKLRYTDSEKYCEGKVKRDPLAGSATELKREADETVQVFSLKKERMRAYLLHHGPASFCQKQAEGGTRRRSESESEEGEKFLGKDPKPSDLVMTRLKWKHGGPNPRMSQNSGMSCD